MSALFVSGVGANSRGVVCLYNVAGALESSLILWAVYFFTASYPFIFSQGALFKDGSLLLWFGFGLRTVLGMLLYFSYVQGVLEW